jgi:hypothetical protein
VNWAKKLTLNGATSRQPNDGVDPLAAAKQWWKEVETFWGSGELIAEH